MPVRSPSKVVPIADHLRAALIDRIEAALEDGRIDLMDDSQDAAEVTLTVGELAMLFEILLPEDHPAELPPDADTSAVAEWIEEPAGMVRIQ